MTDSVTCSLTVALGSGPRWAAARSLKVDAVDTIGVVAGKKAGASATVTKIAVLPGAADKVRFLLILADPYPEKDVTFQGSDKDEKATGTAITLDGPQLLLGTGMVKLLGGSPGTLHVRNASDTDIKLTIVAGRDGTA